MVQEDASCASRNAASGTSYFLSKNRMRFVILLAVLTFLILQNSVRTLISSLINLLGVLPALALQLSFAIV